MKNKTFALFAISLVFVAVLAVFVSAATLAEWDFEDSDVLVDSGSGTLALSSGLNTPTFPAGNSPSAVASVSATGWDSGNDEYFELSVSTANFEDIILSFDEQVSATGPTSFEVQYSSDGTNFNTLTGSTTSTVTSFSTNPMHTFSFASITAIDNNANTKLRIVVLTANGGTGGTFRIDNLLVEGSSTASPTSFCSNGAIDDDDLVLNVDISNKGEGDDEEWQPLDTIEIEVELQNDKDEDGDGDLNDVVFELGLFQEGSTSNIADEMDWESTDEEEVEVGDVDESDDTKHTFIFRVNPNEVDEDDYVLMVKAYPDGDESETCIDYSDDLTDFGSDDNFAEIQVTLENEKEKMVVVDESSYPETIDAFCGSTASFSADVWNVGDDDFVDAVKVSLVNTELGIDLEEVSSGDLDAGDNTQVTFAFNVPSDAEKKIYTLTMRTFYDYDEDDDTYDEVSEDDFFAYLNVQGDCFKTSPATVTASLQSGGKAGEDLVVKATVKNTGTELSTYIVNAAGYSTWAESANVNPGTFTLAAGESKDVLVTLVVSDDASGENTFNVEVVSGNELAVNQPVTVNIEGKSGFLTGSFLGSSGGYTGVLALVTLILVVAIIIVLVKLFRK